MSDDNSEDETTVVSSEEVNEAALYDKTVAEGKKAWNRIKGNKRLWEDWLKVAEALAAGSAYVMDTHGINNNKSKRYATEFSKWLEENGFTGMHKGTRAALIKIHNELDDVEKWRNNPVNYKGLPISSDPIKLNHPANVWSQFESSRKPPDPNKPKKKMVDQDEWNDLIKESDDQIEQIEKLREQNEALQEEVNSGGGNVRGSDDTVADILDIINQRFDDSELESFIDRLLEVAEKRGMLKWKRTLDYQMELADA